MSTPIGFPTLPDCGCNVILPMSKDPCIGDTLDVMFYNISALNVAFQKYIKKEAGKIQIHAGNPNNIPADELVCDGSAYESSEFPQLFVQIGYRHGQLGTKFRVPDYRGQFLRGVDSGSGNDPEASTRTASYPGGSVGDTVGSAQGHAFQRHNHNSTVQLWKYRHTSGSRNGWLNVLTYFNPTPQLGNTNLYTAGGDTTDPIKSVNCATLKVGCETRPVNKNVLFTITTGECAI